MLKKFNLKSFFNKKAQVDSNDDWTPEDDKFISSPEYQKLNVNQRRFYESNWNAQQRAQFRSKMTPVIAPVVAPTAPVAPVIQPKKQIQPQIAPQVKQEVIPEVKPEIKPEIKQEVRPQIKPQTKEVPIPVQQAQSALSANFREKAQTAFIQLVVNDIGIRDLTEFQAKAYEEYINTEEFDDFEDPKTQKGKAIKQYFINKFVKEYQIEQELKNKQNSGQDEKTQRFIQNERQAEQQNKIKQNYQLQQAKKQQQVISGRTDSLKMSAVQTVGQKYGVSGDLLAGSFSASLSAISTVSKISVENLAQYIDQAFSVIKQRINITKQQFDVAHAQKSIQYVIKSILDRQVGTDVSSLNQVSSYLKQKKQEVLLNIQNALIKQGYQNFAHWKTGDKKIVEVARQGNKNKVKDVRVKMSPTKQDSQKSGFMAIYELQGQCQDLYNEVFALAQSGKSNEDLVAYVAQKTRKIAKDRVAHIAQQKQEQKYSVFAKNSQGLPNLPISDQQMKQFELKYPVKKLEGRTLSKGTKNIETMSQQAYILAKYLTGEPKNLQWINNDFSAKIKGSKGRDSIPQQVLRDLVQNPAAGLYAKLPRVLGNIKRVRSGYSEQQAMSERQAMLGLVLSLSSGGTRQAVPSNYVNEKIDVLSDQSVYPKQIKQNLNKYIKYINENDPTRKISVQKQAKDKTILKMLSDILTPGQQWSVNKTYAEDRFMNVSVRGEDATSFMAGTPFASAVIISKQNQKPIIDINKANEILQKNYGQQYVSLKQKMTEQQFKVIRRDTVENRQRLIQAMKNPQMKKVVQDLVSGTKIGIRKQINKILNLGVQKGELVGKDQNGNSKYRFTKQYEFMERILQSAANAVVNDVSNRRKSQQQAPSSKNQGQQTDMMGNIGMENAENRKGIMQKQQVSDEDKTYNDIAKQVLQYSKTIGMMKNFTGKHYFDDGVDAREKTAQYDYLFVTQYLMQKAALEIKNRQFKPVRQGGQNYLKMNNSKDYGSVYYDRKDGPYQNLLKNDLKADYLIQISKIKQAIRSGVSSVQQFSSSPYSAGVDQQFAKVVFNNAQYKDIAEKTKSNKQEIQFSKVNLEQARKGKISDYKFEQLDPNAPKGYAKKTVKNIMETQSLQMWKNLSFTLLPVIVYQDAKFKKINKNTLMKLQDKYGKEMAREMIQKSFKRNSSLKKYLATQLKTQFTIPSAEKSKPQNYRFNVDPIINSLISTAIPTSDISGQQQIKKSKEKSKQAEIVINSIKNMSDAQLINYLTNPQAEIPDQLKPLQDLGRAMSRKNRGQTLAKTYEIMMKIAKINKLQSMRIKIAGKSSELQKIKQQLINQLKGK